MPDQPSLPLAGDVVSERRELADYEPPVAPERALRAPGEQVANVGNLLALAIDKGITPESLEKLVMLQEHCMAKQAKDDFYRAMAGFQADCPIIGKNRKAEIRSDKGSYSYGYADLAMVADTIKPYCEKWGFSYSFDQKFTEGTVETICIVRHEGGHEERTSFSGPSESANKMSAMQKAVAATTTARRLALVLAFGLSVGEDLDGRGALPEEHPQPPRNENAPKTAPRGQRVKPTVTVEQVKALAKNWNGLIATEEQAKDPDGFVKWVQQVCGRAFDARASQQGTKLLLNWTPDDLAKCHAELRAAEGG